ncbi:MAG: AmmeMemoRadiSam system protein B [Nanoarchaeota archaeon]
MDQREPASAGIDYEDRFDKLDEQIRTCFLEEPGPGTLQESRDTEGRSSGFLIPYDTYRLAGCCMAWAYKRIAETAMPDLYIILATNDTASKRGPSGVSSQDWKTPFGAVKTDKEAAKELHRMTGMQLDNPDLFRQSRSIELQLPFLQYASRDRLDRLRILPIIIGHDISAEQIDVVKQGIIQLLKQQKKRAVIIASSNLVHFGERFGYQPFVYNIDESIEDLDYHAMDLIENLDPQGLIEFARKERTTIYGYPSIALLLSLLSPAEPKLLEYYRSDVFEKEKDKKTTESVSYAAIELKKATKTFK